MKCISIRQPWAHAILHLGKCVENRSWPTNYRGPILIHAAKRFVKHEHDFALHFMRDQVGIRKDAWPLVDDLAFGGIVGEAEIVACVTRSESPWFVGPYGFVLANPRPLPFRPCRGQLGIFEVEREEAA